MAAAYVEVFEKIPAQLRRSLTLDQGLEWAAWPSLAATYGLDVWFCDIAPGSLRHLYPEPLRPVEDGPTGSP